MIMIGGGWSLGLNAFRLTTTELRRASKASIHISDRILSTSTSLRRVVGVVVAPTRCEAYGGAICRKVGFVASQG